MSFKTTSRLTALCLCLAVLLSLAGCAEGGAPEASDSGTTEQISFSKKSFPLPEGMSQATAQCLLGDMVFTGGVDSSEAPMLGVVELESGETRSIALPDEIEYIYALYSEGDCAALLCGDASGEASGGRLYVLRYTAGGEPAGELELSETYAESFTLMAGCYGGYVLLSPDALVGIDTNGNETGRISRGDDLPFASMCMDGEEIIIVRSELGKPKSEICTLNTDSFKLKTLSKTDGMVSGLGLWTDGSLLTSDRANNSVKLLDAKTGNGRDFLFLYDLGLENERVVSMEAWADGMVFFYPGQDKISLALPESRSADGPTELILATDTASSPLTLLVSRFNSENSKYKIKIREYENETGLSGKDRLATELMAGNAPDLFVFHQTNFFPEDSGYFEDLLPWLDSDEEYGRETLVPSLFAALTERGALYGLPYEFQMSAYVSRPEAIGGKMSLTIDELTELYQSLDPSQNLFDYVGGLNLRSMLSDLMLNSFIDYEAGTCDFDNPDFLHMLELIKDATPPSTPDENTTGLYDGNYLIRYYPLQNLSIVSGLREEFGDTYDFVELTQDGDNGFGFDPIWNFYMSSQSEHKEGVWEFIRSTFREDAPRDKYGTFIPASQAVFQSQIDAALAGELFIDEVSGIKVTLLQDDVDKLLSLLDKTHHMSDNNSPALQIIYEETSAYLAGAKTAEETAKLIQSRVSIYIAEQS